MADRLTIEITDSGLLSALGNAAAKLERPRELMQLIGATLESNVERRFISKTDPRGAAWLPLSAKTLERKKGRGSLLQLTGHGKASLGYNAGDDFVDVGFGKSYMGFHETGTRRMPRRGLLTDDPNAGTLGAQDQADILADVESFLAGLGFN